MSTPQLATETVSAAANEKIIIVTGFGTFDGHEVINASWEAVRLLPDELDFGGTRYVVEKQLIPVEYSAVDDAVDRIFSKAPELVIHCGVHSTANCIHIEKLAYNHKFTRYDYAAKCLPKPTASLANCVADQSDVIHCGFDVDKIVASIEEACGSTSCTRNDEDASTPEQTDGTLATASTDVGNYLCGYIYLKSLDRDRNRTLFVHVPAVDKPLSSAKTAEVILKCIEECLRQLVQKMPNSS